MEIPGLVKNTRPPRDTRAVAKGILVSSQDLYVLQGSCASSSIVGPLCTACSTRSSGSAWLRAVCSQIRKEPSPCNAVRIILLLVGLAFQDYKDFFIFSLSPSLFILLSSSFSGWSTSLQPRLPNTPSLASLDAALEGNTRNEFYSFLLLNIVRLRMHSRFDDFLKYRRLRRASWMQRFGKKWFDHTGIGRFVNEPLVKPAAVFKFPSFPYSFLSPPPLFFFFFFFSFAQEVRSQWFTTGITVNVDRVAIYIAGRRNDDRAPVGGERARNPAPEQPGRDKRETCNRREWNNGGPRVDQSEERQQSYPACTIHR